MGGATKARRRGRGVAIGASIAVHAAVLALLAISATPALRIPTARFSPDVTLYLEPLQLRPRAQAPSAASARQSAVTAKPIPLPKAANVVAPRPAILPPRALAHPTPSPPTPPAAPTPAAPTAVAGSGTGAPAAPGDGRDWRVRPEGGDVHGLVHEAIGCGHVEYMKLTTAQQAACDRKYASLRGTEMPHVDLIPPAKRAYYDSVAAAYAKVRAGGGSPGRMPVGPPAPALLADKGGLYIPGVGCAIRFGIPRGWKSYQDRPPHSIKLGALPCSIRPPQALGTEESGAPAPASLREQTDDAAHMKALEAPPKG